MPSPRVMMIMVLLRRLDCGAMLILSHADNDAIEATLAIA
jgi:hypothetical protein